MGFPAAYFEDTRCRFGKCPQRVWGIPAAGPEGTAAGVEGTRSLFQGPCQRISGVLAAYFRGSPQFVFWDLCNASLWVFGVIRNKALGLVSREGHIRLQMCCDWFSGVACLLKRNCFAKKGGIRGLRNIRRD